jgi:hypothetical protein
MIVHLEVPSEMVYPRSPSVQLVKKAGVEAKGFTGIESVNRTYNDAQMLYVSKRPLR